MTTPKLAVILAAGSGTRIRDFIGEIPKGFIKLNHKRIIESSIETLIESGIERIIIVTGYLSQYYENLKNQYPDHIEIVKNEKFAESGSMYSLCSPKNIINEDFILLESDLIYEKRSLYTLLNDNRPNVILLSGKTNSGDEVYVGKNSNKIQIISKKREDIKDLAGELVGLSKLSYNTYKAMISFSEESFKESLKREYDSYTISKMSAKHDFYFNLIEDLAWSEIDNEEHYNRALNLVLPKIQINNKKYFIQQKGLHMKPIKRNVLLNPGPATTTDSVKYGMVVPDICPREKEFGQLQDSLRRDLVKIVEGGEDYQTVLFAGSGTLGDEAVICSTVPKNGAILIIDNGAYGTRMYEIAKTYNLETVRYQIPYGTYPDLNEIENLLKANKKLTHLACVHHETTTGMLNPVKDISELAHKYNCDIIVDAMSSFAGMTVPVKKWNIDYLISSSNKCIQGMAGITFVICKKDKLQKGNDLRRSYYLDLFSQHCFFEKTMQMQFTPPVQIAYGLRQAINEFFEETGEGRYSRYRKNFETLYTGLKELGFKFLLPREQESGLLVAICEPCDKAYDFNKMHDFLIERGFTIYPGKGASKATFRLAVIGAIDHNDIKNFLRELKNYIEFYKIKEF